MDAVSLTLPFLPNYISSITIFSEARPRNMDFQRERNMDGCDISNQLTGGFLPSPPPPQQLKETLFCSYKQTKEAMVIAEIK